jgi:predicted metal-dependent hydrolase
MALKLKTAKTKLKTPAKKKATKTSELSGQAQARELVPEACEIKAELAVLEASAAILKKKLTPIEKQIVDLVDPELEGTEAVTLINGDHVLSVSGKTQSRVIKDGEAVVDTLEEFEEGLALKLAKFNLGDLDKYLSPDDMEPLVDIKEGNRRLKYG